MQVMLNPGIALSLLVVLSNSIGARSSFRGPRHFGPLPSISPEEVYEEGSPCQEEDFGFQEACPAGFRRLPPHLLRQQGLQQAGNGQFPNFNEGNKLRIRLPATFPGHDVEKQRWRSPFPLMQGDPNQQFQMCSLGGRMDMPGILPNMSPPFPAQNMMSHQSSGLQFPQKPTQLELQLPTKSQQPHLQPPSQSLRGRSQHFVNEAPTDFQPHRFKSPDVYKFDKEIPPEWGQQTHQQIPPHQPFNHQHRHDPRSSTTPKPLSSFFDDFKPKYVETVPPSTCPVSPLYEPPSHHYHLPHPSTFEHKTGNYASHDSYDTPPTQHGYPYCKSYH